LTPSRRAATCLNQLFRLARTYNEWSAREVDDRTIHELYELLEWDPTSSNSSLQGAYLMLAAQRGEDRATQLVHPCIR